MTTTDEELMQWINNLPEKEREENLKVLGITPPPKKGEKKKGRSQKSRLEKKLARLLQISGISPPESEFYFHPERKWRADFAWPEQKVLVEVEGGIYSRGRHVRGKGYEDDCEKYNEAALLGYTVIRVTARHIKNGKALDWIKRALGGQSD